MESTETELKMTQPHQLKDVEDLTAELKRLLVRHERTLEEEGIRHEVEVLERWMESYRRGLAAASKISENGMEWLSHLRNHLKLAVDELQRLEGEGGAPPSKQQLERMDELIKAVSRIDNVLPEFEHMFHAPAEPESLSN